MRTVLQKTAFFILAVLLLSFPPSSAQAEAETVKSHGLAMHGDLKYGADFTHLEYVEPAAPKGGTLRLSTAGTFDSLHPYIVKGQSAAGLGMVYQTLLESTLDEPFSEYGLLAETIEIPDDRSWVEFTLRPQARWHDGAPVTPEDVRWTFEQLTSVGHPFYRAYYANVKEARVVDAQTVRFVFDQAGNRELPLIMGQMPVLPKHYWTQAGKGRDFSKTTLEAPLGSGPYKIASVIAGKSITYERVADWWAKDLPINKGRYNFDRISYEYYRDETVELQAFLAGEVDFRSENTAKTWATSYTGRGIESGEIIKEEIPHDNPTGMQAFIFNLRKPVFQDARLREALSYAFDFEWSNRQFAYGAYKRTSSYFSNSDLASEGLPTAAELALLEPFRGQVPDAVFDKEFSLPVSDGQGNNRSQLRVAAKMLDEAGYKIGVDKKRLDQNGTPISFEILIQNPAFERWFNPFIANLQKLGITATLRLVDTAQYQNRMDQFDFDMTVAVFPQSQSPGNEQRDFWSSEKADIEGSRNLIGIKNKVIDALIDKVIFAKDRAELVTATRALDRVLLWNHYLIPGWHIDRYRVAYWDKFGNPATPPKYGLGMADTWWVDAGKENALTLLKKK